MSAILVHPASLSLLHLHNGESTPISLPSRFPRDAVPQTCHSGGATFVFAKGYQVVWEYDVRGRRVGEIQGGVGVTAVDGFEGGVVVAAGKEIKVYRRSGGSGVARWAVGKVFEAVNVTALACDGSWLVAAGSTVSAWCLDTEERISLSVEAEVPVTSLGFVGTPPTLVLPSTTGLACVPLAGGMVRDVPLPIAGVVYMSVGSRIALAAPGLNGEIALLDFDTDEVDVLRVKHEVAGVAWVDGSTLAARTTGGKLYLVDTLSEKVTQVKADESVLGLHILPPSTQPRRSVSDQPRVLGESKAINIAVKDKRTVSAPAKSDKRHQSAPAKALIKVAEIENVDTTAAANAQHKVQSQPRAADKPAPASGASTVRIRPAMIEEDDESSDAPTPTASRPSRREQSGSATPVPAPPIAQPSSEVVEALRQEIANLQMDMLRMGRGLKNEIRAAVSPLVDEIKSSRETIARQEAEIVRLRRGY